MVDGVGVVRVVVRNATAQPGRLVGDYLPADGSDVVALTDDARSIEVAPRSALRMPLAADATRHLRVTLRVRRDQEPADMRGTLRLGLAGAPGVTPRSSFRARRRICASIRPASR